MSEKKQYKIYLKGEDRTESVQSFKRIGKKYEVTFIEGKVYSYNASNVRIVEPVANSPKFQNRFEYLKCIANEIGLNIEVEEGKVINILSHHYSKIDFATPDSMLMTFPSSTSIFSQISFAIHLRYSKRFWYLGEFATGSTIRTLLAL